MNNNNKNLMMKFVMADKFFWGNDNIRIEDCVEVWGAGVSCFAEEAHYVAFYGEVFVETSYLYLRYFCFVLKIQIYFVFY